MSNRARAHLAMLSVLLCACGGGGDGDPDGGAPPSDTGAPPADGGGPPADTGAPPADTGAPPTDTGAPPSDGGPTDAGAAGWRPRRGDTWQWQLTTADGAPVNTSYDVAIYDIDLFDNDAAVIAALHGAGRKVLCYFSAGSYEEWRDDAGRFESADLGRNLDGWPGERWLDVGSANVRAIMRDRLDLAVTKGCDGVEPDNVDGYQNSNGLGLTRSDQRDYLLFLSAEAHARGLAIALKNTLELVAEMEPHFDLSVNEECHAFDECALLDPFLDADKPVLQAEYPSPDTLGAAESLAAAVCPDARAAGRSALVLPLDLDDSFRVSCD